MEEKLGDISQMGAACLPSILPGLRGLWDGPLLPHLKAWLPEMEAGLLPSLHFFLNCDFCFSFLFYIILKPHFEIAHDSFNVWFEPEVLVCSDCPDRSYSVPYLCLEGNFLLGSFPALSYPDPLLALPPRAPAVGEQSRPSGWRAPSGLAYSLGCPVLGGVTQHFLCFLLHRCPRSAHPVALGLLASSLWGLVSWRMPSFSAGIFQGLLLCHLVDVLVFM